MTSVADASQLLNDLASFDAQLSPPGSPDRRQELQETPTCSDSEADAEQLHRSELHLIIKSTSSGISTTSSRRTKGGPRKQKPSLVTALAPANSGSSERRGRRSGGNSSSRNLLDEPHSRRSSSYHGREKFDAEFSIKEEEDDEKSPLTALGKLKQRSRSRSIGRKSHTKSKFDDKQELSQSLHVDRHGDPTLAPQIDDSRRSNSADARRRKRRGTAEAILMARDAKQIENSDLSSKGVMEDQDTSSVDRSRRSSSSDARRRRRRSSSEAPEVSQMASMVDSTYARERTSPTKYPSATRRDDVDPPLLRRMSKWEGRRRRQKSGGDYPAQEFNGTDLCSTKEMSDDPKGDIDDNRRSNSFDAQRRRRRSGSDAVVLSEDATNLAESSQRNHYEEDCGRRSGSLDGRRRKQRDTVEAVWVAANPSTSQPPSASFQSEPLEGETHQQKSEIEKNSDDTEANHITENIGHEATEPENDPSESEGGYEFAVVESFSDFPDAFITAERNSEIGTKSNQNGEGGKPAIESTSNLAVLPDSAPHVWNVIENLATQEGIHEKSANEAFNTMAGNGDRRKLLNKQLAAPSMRFGFGSDDSFESSGQVNNHLRINNEQGAFISATTMAVTTPELGGIIEKEEDSESETKDVSVTDAEGFSSMLSPNKVVQLFFKPKFTQESDLDIVFHELEEEDLLQESNSDSPHVKRMSIEGISVSGDCLPFFYSDGSQDSIHSDDLEVNPSTSPTKLNIRLPSERASSMMQQLQSEHEQAESKIAGSLLKIKECEDAIKKLMEELAHQREVYEAAKSEKDSLAQRMKEMHENINQP